MFVADQPCAGLAEWTNVGRIHEWQIWETHAILFGPILWILLLSLRILRVVDGGLCRWSESEVGLVWSNRCRVRTMEKR